MSDKSGIEIVSLESQGGDIPWGEIKERGIVPDISWWGLPNKFDWKEVEDYEKQLAPGEQPDAQKIRELTQARKMRLERVVLRNGLRYAVIRDAETGEESFGADEYRYRSEEGGWTELSRAMDRANLGEGYILKMIMAGRATDEQEPVSVSYVDKSVKVRGGELHWFSYEINPHGKFLAGKYVFSSQREAITVWFNTGPSGGLDYAIIFYDKGTEDQVDFYFPEQGKLEKVDIGRRSLLGEGGTEKELLAFRTTSQRGVIKLEGEGLVTSTTRELIRRLVGIEFGNSLVLDTKGTMEELIKNVDSASPKDPRLCLVFKGARRAVNVRRLSVFEKLLPDFDTNFGLS